MTTQPSTHVEWAMKLSDVTLIGETLRAAAESHERQAAYLLSENYAETQRERYMNAPREKGERRRADWQLSETDLGRITKLQSDAARLRALFEA